MKKLTIGIVSSMLAFSSMAQSNSLTLQQCRQMALEHNEEVQKSGNAVTEAKLDKEVAFSNYLPRLSGNASALLVQDQDIMGMTLKMRGTYFAGFSLTQPIYAGGKIVNGNKLAKVGMECADIQDQKTRADIIADADNAYWTYIAVLEKIRMLETYKAQMDSLCKIIQNTIDAEMGTEYDLIRIQAKASELSYQLQKAKNGANLCRMNLCNIIGDSLSSQITLADTVINVESPSNMSDNIDGRPEVQLLDKNIEAKELQVKMTRGDYLPQVGLQAGYTFYGNIKVEGVTQLEDGTLYPYETNYNGQIGMVMAAAQIPIWNWGEGSKKIKKAKLEVEDAKLDKERNKRLMTIQAQQAIQNVTDSYNMIETAEQGMKEAEENLRIMREKYDNEMGTLTDLLDAQSQWSQAKSNVIEAKTQYKIYETEYQHVTGNLK